ncbi:MAG: hypothetical protein OXP08_03220 [bacterium]|nr:hypothetical protein [bacterium]
MDETTIPEALDVRLYPDPCLRVAHEICHVAQAMRHGDTTLAAERLARVDADLDLIRAELQR